MINQLEPNMVVQRNNFNPGITSFLIITIFTVKKNLFVCVVSKEHQLTDGYQRQTTRSKSIPSQPEK